MDEKKWTDDERDEAFDRGMETMQRVALELYRRGREPLLEELEEARARNADMRAMLEQVTRERDEWRDKFLALNQTAGEICNACGWAFKIPGELCRCEVVKERDEARADLARSVAAWESAGMQGRTAHDAMLALAKERDEARAEVERQRELKDYLRTWLSSEELEGLRVKAAEHPLLWEEIHHLKDEVERLREMAHDFEAMREDRDHHASALKQERREVERLQGDVWALTTTLRNLPVPSPSLVDACTDAYRRGAEAMREACARMEPYAYNLDDHLMISKWRSLVRALPIPEEQ